MRGIDPVASLTYGNGRTLTKTYDLDYAIDRIASSAASGLTLDVTVDVMGNIVDASPTLGGTPSRRYVYDRLYRLTGVNSAAGTPLEAYAYTKTGDRTNKNVGGAAEAYTYVPNAHRLASVGGVARGSDPNGNTTSGLTTGLLQYDQRNRMTLAPQAATAPPTGDTRYAYNGRHERVRKVSTGRRNDAWYHESGKRLSDIEYTRECTSSLARPTGGSIVDWPVEICEGGGIVNTTPVRTIDYVYLDDLPVALVERTPTGRVPAVYYVETDHLGTPRTVADPATNANRWLWDFFQSAFGDHAPTVPPGGVTLEMRYPGQFHDVETGLHYNYFRDYEPRTGRYTQADPIGLEGGLGTYTYVGGRPVSHTDPLGLACNGLGCWNTPTELAYANAGNYGLYYQVACAGGDSYACAARVVATGQGDSVSSMAGAKFTNGNLRNALRRGGSECPEEDMESIRKDLMMARVNQLANATPNNPYRVTAESISDFHNTIFGNYGATDGWGPFPVFGGDIPVIGNMGGWEWCSMPACQP